MSNNCRHCKTGSMNDTKTTYTYNVEVGVNFYWVIQHKIHQEISYTLRNCRKRRHNFRYPKQNKV